MQQLDPYTILLIFYHVDDLKTLYGSCSLVCREWYRTFFAEISDDVIKEGLTPLHNSTFIHALDKIVYLNRMVHVLDLENQYSEWMGTSNCLNNSIYQRLESELIENENLVCFQELLKFKRREYVKLFKKRYMTLSIYCPLVPSIRNCRMAIRNLSRVNSIPEHYKENADFLTSTCQFIVAVTNRKKHSGSVSFYSSVDGECLLKEFNIGDDVKIMSLALTFHPFMNSEYRKLLDNIDPKQPDVNIYALYVLYKGGAGQKYLKKYLVCDMLKGELIIKEQYEFLHNSNFPEFDYLPSLTVSGWEHFGIDLVIINTSKCLFLCTPHQQEAIFHLYIPPFSAYTTTPTSGVALQIHNQIDSSYLMNYTKVLNMRGVSLLDTNKFSNYSVFSLQLGGPIYDNRIDSYYMILAIGKKMNGEYSVFWKFCPQFTKSVDVTDYRYDYMDMREHTQKILHYSNQGKELVTEISHFVVNDSGYKTVEDFYQKHWERNLSQFMDYYDFERIIANYPLWED